MDVEPPAPPSHARDEAEAIIRRAAALGIDPRRVALALGVALPDPPPAGEPATA